MLGPYLISSYLAALGLVSLWLPIASAGYLSVSMSPATQCGISTVQWSGDDGPYHLLLTPTEFKQHGYNVWIESIPAGSNSYNLTIRQPAGLQYMLTMWGASGITFAATTDVLTVGASPTNNASCFLSDQAILDLYSFAFTMNTTNDDDYPPQCSTVSFSWPSSLESNVTSDAPVNVTKRDAVGEVTTAVGNTHDLAIDDIVLNQLDASSSDHKGNTTHPPTMFGIIPLGNSFSIPITFNRTSKYAKYLPDSSLSDQPTTRTRQGLTYLDWTVDMAKGTRFILVAGIGSAEKWASGGSTAMLTVGQGSTGCVGSERNGGGAAPSVTASGSPTQEPTPGQDNSGAHSSSNPLVRTVVAVVCSVIGTLVLVGLIFLCRRARNRRAAAHEGSHGKGNAPFGLFTGRNGQQAAKTVDSSPSGTDAPLDLVGSRDGHGQMTPLVLDERHHTGSPSTSPVDYRDPFRDSNKQPFLGGPSRSSTMDGFNTSSPISPARDRENFHTPGLGRNGSQDLLLPLGGSVGMLPDLPQLSTIDLGTGFGSGSGAGTMLGGGVSTWQSSSRGGGAGPLVLHNGSARDDRSDEDGEGTDMSDLKRDTLAHFGGSATSSLPPGAGAPSIMTTSTGRRRRNQTQPGATELEYMVHRDAGRVVPPQRSETATTVLELPPRYEELRWTEEETREREERERQTR
nr:uncharacterized protein CI109_004376 [Kwoniella shandongensis]KAA5527316.1 hypothetical protein CI109_004376 [Kwoniella shandongensis]